MKDNYVNNFEVNTPESGSEMAMKIIASCLANGKKVDAYQLIDDYLEPDEDNSVIQEQLAFLKIMSKSDFDKALKKKKFNRKVEAFLGFVPKHPMDYVEKYVEKKALNINFKGVMSMDNITEIDGIKLQPSDYDDPAVRRQIKLKKNQDYGINNLILDLKIARNTLDLPYQDSQIVDSVESWTIRQRNEATFKMYDRVLFQPGTLAAGPLPQKEWERMEAAFFDVSETKKGLAVAVLKKFIWQVKRKGLGMIVTNHLMPVIVGDQGCGKTWFVTRFLSCIEEGVNQVGFDNLTDDTQAEIYKSPVLLLDEMSGVKKADMAKVKKRITESEFTFRKLYSRLPEVAKQKATLIGCSNDPISEIINDPTGIRRFAELKAKAKPDHETINELDWKLMWQSVDEEGPDPTAEFMDVLKASQESNRQKCNVEMWALEEEGKFNDWTKASQVFVYFHEWERVHGGNTNTSQKIFGSRMKRLIEQNKIKWERSESGGNTKLRSENKQQSKIKDLLKKGGGNSRQQP